MKVITSAVLLSAKRSSHDGSLTEGNDRNLGVVYGKGVKCINGYGIVAPVYIFSFHSQLLAPTHMRGTATSESNAAAFALWFVNRLNSPSRSVLLRKIFASGRDSCHEKSCGKKERTSEEVQANVISILQTSCMSAVAACYGIVPSGCGA